MRCGRARGLMPGASLFWHVRLWNMGEPKEWCLWSNVFYKSSYGLWESQDWCLWSSIFIHIKLWIAGEPGPMPLVKYFLHIQLWITGESEACYLWQDWYRSSHEMWEGQSNRTSDALWRPDHLLLFIVVLPIVVFPLLCFILFVHVNNTGFSVRVVLLWPSILIVSLNVSFSFQWFGPETIESD